MRDDGDTGSINVLIIEDNPGDRRLIVHGSPPSTTLPNLSGSGLCSQLAALTAGTAHYPRSWPGLPRSTPGSNSQAHSSLLVDHSRQEVGLALVECVLQTDALADSSRKPKMCWWGIRISTSSSSTAPAMVEPIDDLEPRIGAALSELSLLRCHRAGRLLILRREVTLIARGAAAPRDSQASHHSEGSFIENTSTRCARHRNRRVGRTAREGS
jgi:hypothetical protein